jgi:hypothetical protein
MSSWDGQERVGDDTTRTAHKILRWCEMTDKDVQFLREIGTLLAHFERARRIEAGIWALGENKQARGAGDKT